MNKDLSDVLGNFVSRITKFCRSKFGEAVPEGGEWGEAERALEARLEDLLRRYEGHMEGIEIRRAAATLREIWAAGNEYLQAAAPWTRFKTDPEGAAAQVRLGLNLARLYAVLSAPFIPATSATLSAALRTDDAWPAGAAEALRALPPGHAFTVPDNLFAKIDDDVRRACEERFSGGGPV